MTRELLIEQFDADEATIAAYDAYVAKRNHVNMANQDSGTIRCLWYLFDIKNKEPVSEVNGQDIHIRHICFNFTRKPRPAKWSAKSIEGRLLFAGSVRKMEWSGRNVSGNGLIRVSAPLTCGAIGDETLETKFGHSRTSISVLVTSTESADANKPVLRVDPSDQIPSGPNWTELEGEELEQVARMIRKVIRSKSELDSNLVVATGENLSEFIDTTRAYNKGAVVDLIQELTARGLAIKFLNKVKSERPDHEELQQLLKSLPDT